MLLTAASLSGAMNVTSVINDRAVDLARLTAPLRLSACHSCGHVDKRDRPGRQRDERATGAERDGGAVVARGGRRRGSRGKAGRVDDNGLVQHGGILRRDRHDSHAAGAAGAAVALPLLPLEAAFAPPPYAPPLAAIGAARTNRYVELVAHLEAGNVHDYFLA